MTHIKTAEEKLKYYLKDLEGNFNQFAIERIAEKMLPRFQIEEVVNLRTALEQANSRIANLEAALSAVPENRIGDGNEMAQQSAQEPESKKGLKEDFEDWCWNPSVNSVNFDTSKNDAGEYIDMQTNGAYQAWIYLKAQQSAQEQNALAEMEARKDAAYLERNQVVAALAKCFPSGIAKTAIEGWSEDWHSCVYIDLPTGQASWHYHDSQAYLFSDLPTYKGKWDGHTTEEKYARIAKLQPAQEPIAENAKLKATISDLTKAYERESNDCLEALEERDYWYNKADALADKISEVFDVPIGEHSNVNCPITEAFKILDGEYVTKFDKENAAQAKRIAELESELVEWNEFKKIRDMQMQALRKQMS